MEGANLIIKWIVMMCLIMCHRSRVGLAKAGDGWLNNISMSSLPRLS